MSSRATDLPFLRGQTAGVSAAGEMIGWEGREFVVPDEVYDTGMDVRLRCVRNASGISLEAKRLVTPVSTNYGRVDGYADVSPESPAWPVDDQYGSMTIANQDLFYVVVEGPCLIKTSLAAGAENVITANDWVISGTAVTSQATTSGRIAGVDLTGATTPLARQIMNVVGRAMTARTTANTNTDTLVMVGKRW